MKKLPVVAVVPAHNSAKTIGSLLEELIRQKYDEIYVIDDASNDETAKIAKAFGKKVQVIENDENVGSGANRNRIIGRTDKALLHFIDSDMQLLSKNTPEIIRKMEWSDDTAYVGGKIRNPNGSQNPFNFGPRASFVTTITSFIIFLIWLLGLRFERPASWLRRALNPILRSWPDIYRPAKRQLTFWTAESNMIFRSEVYEMLGGYDPIFRYGEINDLSLRLHHLGLRTYFDPRIDTLHASLDNIYNRRKEKAKAHRQYLKKHGHLKWWIPKLADYRAGLNTQKRYQR